MLSVEQFEKVLEHLEEYKKLYLLTYKNTESFNSEIVASVSNLSKEIILIIKNYTSTFDYLKSRKNLKDVLDCYDNKSDNLYRLLIDKKLELLDNIDEYAWEKVQYDSQDMEFDPKNYYYYIKD